MTATIMVKILKTDKFQKGENVIACKYKSAKEAIREIHKSLFT